jgi:hypothetical protein
VTVDPRSLLDAVDLRVFVYDRLFARGLPPTAAEIAEHWGIDEGAAKRMLGALKIGKTLLAHPTTGEIWMAGPFASSPTPYRVVGSHASWWANCAWDMLGIAALADEPVRIDASCTDCAAPVTIRADPLTGPRDQGIVHFLLPARRWYDDIGFT